MYTASCHCGAIRLEMQRKPRKLTQCNCSICRRYGALWAYFQRKSVHVRVSGDRLKSYSWLNERFDFYHCGECGCVTHYERRDRRPDGSDMSGVNLRNIDDPGLISHLPIRLLDGAYSWTTLFEAPQPCLLRSPIPDDADRS
jgi:hypothetical protein